ncbi:MAG: PqqD family protein [Oscillospiraceae bacterium]|nr:PqqD family protein [Oscillospiraceae bacterium]
MKIKEQYVLRYDMDEIYIAEKTTEGLRDICPISETAAMAWEGLERGMEKKELARRITDEFSGAELAQVEQDLDALIVQLAQLGYIEE